MHKLNGPSSEIYDSSVATEGRDSNPVTIRIVSGVSYSCRHNLLKEEFHFSSIICGEIIYLDIFKDFEFTVKIM